MMRLVFASFFLFFALSANASDSGSGDSSITESPSAETIVDQACNGEVYWAYEASLGHPSLRSDAKLAHIISALHLVLHADVAKAVDMHKLAKSIDPKQMPPLATLYLNGKTCGGLADIYYLAAVRIKAHVDGGLTSELLSKTHIVLIPLLSDSGLDEAAERHLQAAIELNPSDSALRFRSALMTPATYDSSSQIDAVRRLLERRLKELTSISDLQLAGMDNFSLVTTFYLVYQGYNDKEFLTSLHETYARAYPAYFRDEYTPLHPVMQDEVLTSNNASNPSLNEGSEDIDSETTDDTVVEIAPEKKRVIRVGFVSAHFRRHSICKLYCGMIPRLKGAALKAFGDSSASLEVYVFSTAKQAREDATTAESILRHAELITTATVNGSTTEQNTAEAPSRGGFAIKEFVRVDASIVANRHLVLSRDIDVLIYLDIGMVPTTNLWAAARLAPIQMVTWGHPSTTGLPHIDYFLSSELYYTDSNALLIRSNLTTARESIDGTDASDTTDHVTTDTEESSKPLPLFTPADDHSYSEQRVLGSSLGIFFDRKSVELPGVTSEDETDTLLIERSLELYHKLREAHSGHESLLRLLKMRIDDIESETERMVMVCPQQLPKLHPDFDAVIRDLLVSIPNSVFVVIHDDTMKYQWRRTILSRWNRTLHADSDTITSNTADGASALMDRIIWVSGMNSQQYLALLTASDVMIDPFPFGGGVTTLEALAVLTPVLTLPRMQTVPALTAGILSKLLGTLRDTSLLNSLIAQSPSDLVQKAASFASNPSALVEARAVIHQFIDNRLFRQDDSVTELASTIVRAYRGVMV